MAAGVTHLRPTGLGGVENCGVAALEVGRGVGRLGFGLGHGLSLGLVGGKKASDVGEGGGAMVERGCGDYPAGEGCKEGGNHGGKCTTGAS